MADETPAPPKPGYKTTEFWLTAVVSLVGILMASGLIQPGSVWDKGIGLAMAALSTMGYATGRSNVKSQ